MYAILLVLLPIHICSYCLLPLVIFEIVYCLGILLRMVICFINNEKILLSKSNNTALWFYSFEVKNDMFIGNISIIAFVISPTFLLADFLLSAYRDNIEITLKLDDKGLGSVCQK